MSAQSDPRGEDVPPRDRPRAEPITAVEVYWRSGCVSCHVLRRGLRRRGIPVREVDIWAGDPAAAARVRAVAGGNETVPTVFIGPRALVAPGVRDVLRALADIAPNLVSGPVLDRRGRITAALRRNRRS